MSSRPDARTATVAARDERLANGLVARRYQPREDDSCHLLIYLHGGGFVACSLETHDDLCRRLAIAARSTVVAIEYPLAPEYPAPAQLDRSLDACRTILAENQDSSFRPRLVLAGDSAGGYLAARCALALNSGLAGTVDQLILFYPLADPSPETNAMRGLGRITTRWMRSLTGQIAYRSLLNEPLNLLPSTLVVTGRRLDPTYRNTRHLVERLRGLAVPVKFIEFPWLAHGGLNFAHRSGAISKIFDHATIEIRSFLSS